MSDVGAEANSHSGKERMKASIGLVEPGTPANLRLSWWSPDSQWRAGAACRIKARSWRRTREDERL